MKNKIPTAEEYLTRRQKELGYNPCVDFERTQATLVEFAKLHVKAALASAAEKAETDGQHGCIDFGAMCEKVKIDEQSILNAYPENLIK